MLRSGPQREQARIRTAGYTRLRLNTGATPGAHVGVPALPRVLLAGLAGVVAVLAVAALGSAASEHAFAYFVRDPAAAVRLDGCEGIACSYAGAVSNVGIVLWLTAATLTLAAALLGRRMGIDRRALSLLWWGGALTAALGLDDLFELHEYAIPALIPHGQELTYLAYGIACLALLALHRALLLRCDVWLLLVSGALLVVSAVADEILPRNHLLEDGSKLLAIVLWGIFFVGTATALVWRAVPVRSAS